VLNYKKGIQELDRQARQRWFDDELAAVNKLKREKLNSETWGKASSTR